MVCELLSNEYYIKNGKEFVRMGKSTSNLEASCPMESFGDWKEELRTSKANEKEN